MRSGQTSGPTVTDAEARITRIWSDVLAADHIERDADLLDLGGDSQTMAWLATRLRAEFVGCAIQARDLLVTASTVAGLTELIGTLPLAIELSSQQEALLGRIEHSRRQGLPMRAFTVTTATELAGPLDTAALGTALARVVAHQAALRTSYRRDPEWQVELNRPEPPALVITEPVGSTVEREHRATELLRTASHTAFNPADPVRLRPLLVRLAPDRHVLSLVLDHIVADGHSVAVLHAELARHYAELTGRDTVAPAPDSGPTHAFFDHVAAQRRFTDSAGTAVIEYWRRVLADRVAAEQPLPFERTVPIDTPTSADTVRRTLPPELMFTVDATARAVRSTRFRLLLAALYVALHQATGTTDLMITAPDAGRDDPGTHDSVGWFATLLPYRIDLSGDPTLADVLDRVREVCDGVQAHKQITYRDITRALAPDTFALPRTATWVSLVVAETGALDLPGLHCTPWPLPADAPNRALEFELDGAELRVNFDANRFPRRNVADLLVRTVAALRSLTQDRTRRLMEIW